MTEIPTGVGSQEARRDTGKKKEKPIISRRFNKPRDRKGGTWHPLHEDLYRKHFRTGWVWRRDADPDEQSKSIATLTTKTSAGNERIVEVVPDPITGDLVGVTKQKENAQIPSDLISWDPDIEMPEDD